MGFFEFFRWGLLLQAIAIVHFIRRRPDTFWLYVIIFLGGLGAFVYIAVEMVPDLGLLRGMYDALGRRKRIKLLEALVLENPASGNYEELGDLLLDEQQFARAKECYDRAIGPRTPHLDPIYRRGIAEIHLGNFAAAVTDLETVTAREPKYDSHRAMALLAHAYANAGQTRKRCSSSARDGALHPFGDLPQLRYVPRLAEPERRSPRVGPTHPRAQGDDASLSAASRAPVVSQSEGAAQESTVSRRALSFWRLGGSVHSSRVAFAISARKKLSFMPPSMMSHGSTGSAERSRNT
jgi:hypothetical protein